MNPVLVAHGTRKSSGVQMIGELAARVGTLLGQPVRVAFVDVLPRNPGGKVVKPLLREIV